MTFPLRKYFIQPVWRLHLKAAGLKNNTTTSSNPHISADSARICTLNSIHKLITLALSSLLWELLRTLSLTALWETLSIILPKLLKLDTRKWLRLTAKAQGSSTSLSMRELVIKKSSCRTDTSWLNYWKSSKTNLSWPTLSVEAKLQSAIFRLEKTSPSSTPLLMVL